MRLLAATTLCAVLVAPAFASAQPTQQKMFKAVLVTGASSGIGRKITERLAADGYFVYATARKEEDLKALGAIRNVQSIRLDVTHPADIAAAVESVAKAGRGLYGLVNNAGVVTFGTIADMTPEEFDLCMKVNVYRPVLMTIVTHPAQFTVVRPSASLSATHAASTHKLFFAGRWRVGHLGSLSTHSVHEVIARLCSTQSKNRGDGE